MGLRCAHLTHPFRLHEGWHLHSKLPWLDQTCARDLYGLHWILCRIRSANRRSRPNVDLDISNIETRWSLERLKLELGRRFNGIFQGVLLL